MKPDISKGHRILIPSHTVAYIHNFTLFQLDSALSDYLSPIWLARLLEPDSGSRPQCRFNPSRTASNSKNSGLQTSSKLGLNQDQGTPKSLLSGVRRRTSIPEAPPHWDLGPRTAESFLGGIQTKMEPRLVIV